MGFGEHPNVCVYSLHLLKDPNILGEANSAGDIPRRDLHRVDRCRLLLHPQEAQLRHPKTPLRAKRL